MLGRSCAVSPHSEINPPGSPISMAHMCPHFYSAAAAPGSTGRSNVLAFQATTNGLSPNLCGLLSSTNPALDQGKWGSPYFPELVFNILPGPALDCPQLVQGVGQCRGLCPVCTYLLLTLPVLYPRIEAFELESLEFGIFSL